MSSIASTVFGDSLERASVMVRLTAEKSLSDWAEMQRMRLSLDVHCIILNIKVMGIKKYSWLQLIFTSAVWQ